MSVRPRVLAQARVLGQRLRVRRQQLRLVALHRRLHATGDEVGRVLEQPDELVDHLDHLDRDRPLRVLALGDEEHRCVGVALAQLLQQRGRLRVRFRAVRAEVPVEQDRPDGRVDADDRVAVLERQRAHHLDVARLDRVGEAHGGAAERGLGLREAVVDEEHPRAQRAGVGIQHGLGTPGSSRAVVRP
jgi:hypothetical protein